MQLLNINDVNRVSVLGLGTMGQGWVTQLLMSGLNVTGYEVDANQQDTGVRLVGKYIGKAHAKGRLPDATNGMEVADIMARLTMVDSIDSLTKAGDPIVLEVVTEDLDLKCKIFAELGDKVGENVIAYRY